MEIRESKLNLLPIYVWQCQEGETDYIYTINKFDISTRFDENKTKFTSRNKHLSAFGL